MTLLRFGPDAKREWSAGWTLVTASTIGVTASPLMVYTTGLFIGPLEAEFGWSRAQIASGLAINSVVAVLLSPFVGSLIDKMGTRKIAIPGMVLFCTAFAALATTTSSLLHWWGLWLVTSLMALGVKPTVWVTAVTSRFNKSRGLALAVTLCGSGLSGILGPALAGHLVPHLGWRMSYVAIAAIWAAVALPLIVLFFFSATDVERARGGSQSEFNRLILPGASPKEGLRSVRYWQLAIGVWLVVFVVAASMVHFVPFLNARGVDTQSAGNIAAVIGMGSIIGRLITGLLLDRLNGPLVGGAAFALPAIVALGLLAFDGSHGVALALAFLLGLSVGAEYDIAAYLTSRYFGLLNYGLFFGVLVGLMTFAAGAGPLTAGFVYDLSGSYRAALWGSIPICLLSGLLMATLGPYDSRFSPSTHEENSAT